MKAAATATLRLFSMRMNKLDYIHHLLCEWASWLRDGRATPGLYSTTSWPTGRPKIKGRMVVSHVPETRKPAESRPLTARTEPKLERVHAAVLTLDDDCKRIVVLLYLYRLGWPACRQILGMSSRQISNTRYRITQVVESRLNR